MCPKAHGQPRKMRCPLNGGAPYAGFEPVLVRCGTAPSGTLPSRGQNGIFEEIKNRLLRSAAAASTVHWVARVFLGGLSHGFGLLVFRVMTFILCTESIISLPNIRLLCKDLALETLETHKKPPRIRQFYWTVLDDQLLLCDYWYRCKNLPRQNGDTAFCWGSPGYKMGMTCSCREA